MKLIIALWALSLPAFAQAPKFAVKTDVLEPPKGTAEAIAKVLDADAFSVRTEDGKMHAQFWLRKEVPSNANAEQIKNGLTYREIPEGTLLGIVKFEADFIDFRKQEIKAGAYTIRLAVQPDIGDHKDTAPHQDFCLLVPLAADKIPDAVETKDLVKMSLKSTGGDHPGVMLLFPHFGKEADAKIAAKPGNIAVLNVKRPIAAGEKKTALGFGFVVAGFSDKR